MQITSFSELSLSEPVARALRDLGYETPTPIQAQAIPPLLEGRDLLGCAQTGTGKTAAFALPAIEYLLKNPLALRQPKTARVLVVAPTRELAIQIDDSFKDYTKYLKLSHACVYGGVGKDKQRKELARGVDVLCATPGRLLDLHQEGNVNLGRAEIVVLDEADRMLDMGFIHDVRKIIALLPKERTTLLFSATMPPEIAEIAAGILKNPVRVDVAPESTTVEKVRQNLAFMNRTDKPAFLMELLKRPEMKRVIVFSKTKHLANKLAKRLSESGIYADAIHANKSQNARERSLEDFKKGKIRVLIATDIAARGIDVNDITHVVNYDLPTEPETYVHRIGRTARAGADGEAWTMCAEDELDMTARVERLTGIPMQRPAGLPCARDLGYDSVYARITNRRQSMPPQRKKQTHAEHTILSAEKRRESRPFESRLKPSSPRRETSRPSGKDAGFPQDGMPSGNREGGNLHPRDRAKLQTAQGMDEPNGNREGGNLRPEERPDYQGNRGGRQGQGGRGGTPRQGYGDRQGGFRQGSGYGNPKSQRPQGPGQANKGGNRPSPNPAGRNPGRPESQKPGAPRQGTPRQGTPRQGAPRQSDAAADAARLRKIRDSINGVTGNAKASKLGDQSN